MNTIMKWKDSVGSGWYPIIEEAIVDIEKHGGFIVQIKEKFGGLRIYVQGGDFDAIDTVVRNAEGKAAIVCEECGKPGQLDQSGYWLKTYCVEHIAERKIAS